VRRCIAAYGDAVLPDLAEMIGRTMAELVPTDGTVLDLFVGGAGGWSLGLQRAGFRTVAAVEIDPWRRAVLARNFGGTAG
jgi:predicted RNA methylase